MDLFQYVLTILPMLSSLLDCNYNNVIVDLFFHTSYSKVLRAKKRPKTRYEYNIERVRDFRVGKEQDEARMGKVKVLKKILLVPLNYVNYISGVYATTNEIKYWNIGLPLCTSRTTIDAFCSGKPLTSRCR